MSTRLDRVDPAARLAAADRARVAYDVTMPRLSWFNDQPCDRHADAEAPQVGCPHCGFRLRRHQRVAVPWLYLIQRGLLADATGVGKTITSAALIAMLAGTSELDPNQGGGRVLIVVRPAALRQWRAELRRAIPNIPTEMAVGSKAQRTDRYAEPWDVLLIGHQMLLRDVEQIERLGIRHLVVDDVDPIRHRETKTAWAVKRIARACDRVIVMNATPLQKRLEELYGVLELIGGRDVLGSHPAFMRRYVVTEPTTIYTKGGKKRTVVKPVAYRNVDEFRQLIAPMTLRRTADDIDDIELPGVVVDNVMLDLHRSQRERYEELRTGVLRIVREQGEEVKQTSAGALAMYGAKICEGLAALGDPDRPGEHGNSVKFDWVIDKVTGDWAGESDDDPGEKVVVFCHFKDGVRALSQRLTAEGVGHVLFWGENRDADARARDVERFWHDPSVRVLIGTTAIEQSLNLQVARRLVNVDQILNPARMTQLAGRIRRDGSVHRTVYVHNLLTLDTQEERYLSKLEQEQGLSDYVWGDESELFAALSPIQLLQLIVPEDQLRARRRRTTRGGSA